MENINFHHYGLALKDFNNAIKFHANLGYQCSEIIFDSLQNVELVLCTSDNFPTVELVKPYNSNSPISNYLKKNNEMIYHVCYEINNYEEDLIRIFGENRAICVSTPKPAILFENRLVSFYYITDVGLIELLQQK